VGVLTVVTLTAYTSGAAFGATAPGLGAAAPYAVLAGSTVTNTGPTVVTGNVGLSPGTSVTGFTPGTATGTIMAADAASLNAQNSNTAAYLVASGEASTSTVSAPLGGGTTLTPGVYSGGALQLNGALTLDGGGDPSAVFIFQAASTLTTASSSSVILENGAQACNVFWTVGSSATLGTSTTFVGNILALTDITLTTDASVEGSVMAQNGAVTLDTNTISIATCAAPSVTPPATPTTTTTTTSTTAPTTTTTIPVVTTATGPSAPVNGTKPGGTTTPIKSAKPGTSTKPTTSSDSGAGATIIPLGAPATGEGGAAGTSFSPLGLIGLGGFAVAAGSLGVATRRRRHN
jgi:ice-binding like protein